MAQNNNDEVMSAPTANSVATVNPSPTNNKNFKQMNCVQMSSNDPSAVSVADGCNGTSPKSNCSSRSNSRAFNNAKPDNLKIQVNSLYSNEDEVTKESDALLKKNSVGGVRIEDETKPVLHVQFNNDKTVKSTVAIKPKSPSISSTSTSSTGSSSSSSSSDSLELTEARPPDGGWGWVVVAASFVVNLIADGITFSFGIIFVEFLNYFGENRGTTAWIGGLFMAMPLLSGPIASFLTDRYGCRQVTIFGSILAALGFVISSKANNMIVLCLTFGILAGFGLSLCYVASVVIVAYYFDKKRSFATGLAVCGSGIGTFIFAPFIQYLLNEYGWRGTTLILAGLLLNLAVCGALMRDLPWTSEKKKNMAKDRKKKRHLKRKNKGSSGDSFSVSNSTNTASVLQPIIEHEDENEEGNANRLCSSLVNLPTYVRNGEKVPIEVLELLSTHKNVYNVLLANYPSLLTPSRSFSDSGRLHEGFIASKHAHTQAELSPPPINCEDSAYLCWLKKNQMSPPRMNHHKKVPATAAFLRDLRVHRLSVTYRGAMLNIHRYRLRASSCPDIYRNSMTTIAKEMTDWYAGFWDLWDLLVDMFDVSHFADPKFFVFALSNFLLYTWYDVPYVYLTDYAIKVGYEENEASILISIIGIINMIGEIFLGWIGDRQWANASIVYALCMGLCGIMALVPLITNYWYLCFIAGAYGFLIAANYSLTCIILMELITLERFTNAYGLLLLVQGVANLIGPYIGGTLIDKTGTYDLSFYLAGFFIAFSGLMLLIIPLAKKYKQYKSRHSSQEVVDNQTTAESANNESIN